MDHCDGFFSHRTGRLLQIQLRLDGNDEDKVFSGRALNHQRFIDLLMGQTQQIRHLHAVRKFLTLISIMRVRDFHTVQNAHGICLDFLVF